MNANQSQPARTTRKLTLGSPKAPTVIPANTDTTARYSAGSETLVVITYQGRSHLVPVTAVRFL